MPNQSTALATKSAQMAGISFGGIPHEVSGDTFLTFQNAINISTNLELDINEIVIGNVKMLAIEATKDCDLYTNFPAGDEDNHIVVKANRPIIWQEGDLAGAMPLTTNVTKIYITNAQALTLKIAVLQNTIND